MTGCGTKRFKLVTTLRESYTDLDDIDNEKYKKWKASSTSIGKGKKVKTNRIRGTKQSILATQCEGHTVKGRQCRNMTKNSSGCCYLHT